MPMRSRRRGTHADPVVLVSGYLLGANWQAVDRYAGILKNVVIAVVAVAVVLFVIVRVRERRSAEP
jgi:membrane protein DedA with SNARE-associated domain